MMGLRLPRAPSGRGILLACDYPGRCPGLEELRRFQRRGPASPSSGVICRVRAITECFACVGGGKDPIAPFVESRVSHPTLARPLDKGRELELVARKDSRVVAGTGARP